MQQNWYLIFAYALIESFLVSMVLTTALRLLALRWGIVDRPGLRKMHLEPVPLLGGAAIYGTFMLVIFGNLAVLRIAGRFRFEWLEENVFFFLGENVTRPLTGIFAGASLIFLLGIVDDVKALKPEIKLIGQIVAALVLVLSGIRLDLFIDSLLLQIAFTEGLSEFWLNTINQSISGFVTIFWIVMMTNAMNFLDNMDGLAGGIATIAAFSFFLCVLPREQYFVCVMLMVFAGSVAGFLFHNLSPARIFMGDAGSMFCGYILSIVAVIGTFYVEEGSSRIAITAPLLALCVPIFDTLSVVFLRWRRGESIMKGDKRHFSHRLVELGMTRRQAVDFIFLVAVITGLGAALLPKVSVVGTSIILVQTFGIFLLIVILMNVGRNGENGDRGGGPG